MIPKSQQSGNHGTLADGNRRTTELQITAAGKPLFPGPRQPRSCRIRTHDNMRTKTQGLRAMREPGRTESRQSRHQDTRTLGSPGWAGRKMPPGRAERPTPTRRSLPETCRNREEKTGPREGTQPAPRHGPPGDPSARERRRRRAVPVNHGANTLPGSPGLVGHVPAAPPGCPRDPAGGRQEDRTGKTAARRPDSGATAAGCPRKRPRRRSTASQRRSTASQSRSPAQGPGRGKGAFTRKPGPSEGIFPAGGPGEMPGSPEESTDGREKTLLEPGVHCGPDQERRRNKAHGGEGRPCVRITRTHTAGGVEPPGDRGWRGVVYSGRPGTARSGILREVPGTIHLPLEGRMFAKTHSPRPRHRQRNFTPTRQAEIIV